MNQKDFGMASEKFDKTCDACVDISNTAIESIFDFTKGEVNNTIVSMILCGNLIKKIALYRAKHEYPVDDDFIKATERFCDVVADDIVSETAIDWAKDSAAKEINNIIDKLRGKDGKTNDSTSV